MIFKLLKINNKNLYDIADTKTKNMVNTYIEELKDLGLLNGYFGMFAKNIYSRTRVKNSEILELYIYGAYIEEQNKLDEYEKQIIYEDTNYYFQEGQKEVKKQKKYSVIPDAIFLALLDQANSSGFNFKQYIEIIIRYNAEQLYKQVLINIMQQKELEIVNNEFQRILNQQQNAKLCINDDKISGSMDSIMIGINNLAKVEGIRELDSSAKVRFIAIIDGNETAMCHSLDRQEFYIDKENVFDRYYGETQKELRIERIKCKGLVLGINLPPISHHFHWCRSYIEYLPVEKINKKWYNKLGNSNKNSIGGSGKGKFIEKIKQSQIEEKLKEYEEDIRNMLIEYAVLIDKKGNIYAYKGEKTNLDITDRSLSDTIITHNHPEVGAFGKDDFNLLKENPKIKELRAVDNEYTYSLKLIKPLDITYNELYIKSSQLAFETGEEIQHCTMLKLKEMGYIKYDRTRKK